MDRSGELKGMVRADKIDLKSIDLQLSKVLSKTFKTSKKPEAWEIDPTALEIRQHVAQGTYRGTYMGQDVDGTIFYLNIVGFVYMPYLLNLFSSYLAFKYQ